MLVMLVVGSSFQNWVQFVLDRFPRQRECCSSECDIMLARKARRTPSVSLDRLILFVVRWCSLPDLGVRLLLRLARWATVWPDAWKIFQHCQNQKIIVAKSDCWEDSALQMHAIACYVVVVKRLEGPTPSARIGEVAIWPRTAGSEVHLTG